MTTQHEVTRQTEAEANSLLTLLESGKHLVSIERKNTATLLRQLIAERDQLREQVEQARHESSLLCLDIDALESDRKSLREQLKFALYRLEDMLKGDDGQAWKEAQRFVDAARKDASEAQWLGFTPEPEDEQQTGDASDGCGEPYDEYDDQEQDG